MPNLGLPKLPGEGGMGELAASKGVVELEGATTSLLGVRRAVGEAATLAQTRGCLLGAGAGAEEVAAAA